LAECLPTNYILQKELERRHRLELELLIDAIESSDLDRIEEIVDLPGGKETKDFIAYLIQCNALKEARGLLTVLESQSVDLDFCRIQNIYLDFTEYYRSFELDSLDRAWLIELANGTDANCPHARSLLSLLTPLRFGYSDAIRGSDLHLIDRSSQSSSISDEIILSPNPSSELLYLTGVGIDEVSSVRVLALNAQDVVLLDVLDNTIDISRLRRGLYLVQLLTNTGELVETQKIIKY